MTTANRRRWLGRCIGSTLALPMLPVAFAAPDPMSANPTPPLQVPAFGRVERLHAFASRHVDARPVEVWLPPHYEAQARTGTRFAVLYMHDGQMLFDARTTWNQRAWQVDRVAAPRMAGGELRDFIVVGPWNNGKFRHSEYFPAKFLPHLPPALRERFTAQALQGGARSDAYLRFLVEELKPAIDARFATLSGRESTFLMGSSMGGMISVYGLCEYPQVFGGAAALSTHWIGSFERNAELPQAAIAYLQDALPDPATVKLWTDRGSTELDAQYVEAHARVTDALRARGYRAPGFVAHVAEGTGHNESDWSARLHEPLRFLLGRS